MSKQKTPEEVIKYEFDNDPDLMVKEILRLRAEKNYPLISYPQYPYYDPWTYPGTWC